MIVFKSLNVIIICFPLEIFPSKHLVYLQDFKKAQSLSRIRTFVYTTSRLKFATSIQYLSLFSSNILLYDKARHHKGLITFLSFSEVTPFKFKIDLGLILGSKSEKIKNIEVQ